MPTDLISYSGTPLSLRDRRRDRAELREAARPGRHALVRVKAGYLITTVGLIYLEELTEREVAVCRRCGPIVDDRARSIVDGFVAGVRTELSLLPMRGE
jgi:hypothetical protein